MLVKKYNRLEDKQKILKCFLVYIFIKKTDLPLIIGRSVFHIF